MYFFCREWACVIWGLQRSVEKTRKHELGVSKVSSWYQGTRTSLDRQSLPLPSKSMVTPGK